MMIQLFFYASLLLSSYASSAESQASAETRLEKLSRSLRGVPASLEERRDLKLALKNNTEEAFFNRVIQDSLGSEFFEFKLSRKINELYRFRIDQRMQSEFQDPELATIRSDFETSEQFRSHKTLIKKIIRENLSWDELVLHKQYHIIHNDSDFDFGSFEKKFFETLMAQKSNARSLEQIIRGVSFEIGTRGKHLQSLSFNFDPSDVRVAGLLTTPTFLQRYVNTALNKNRKRAAALFRILFCDPMVAAIPAKTSETDLKDLDLAFPQQSSSEVLTEDEIHKNVREADLHGTQADCRACHEKLDPVGQVFAFASAGLGPTASPGALSYRSRAGQRILIPVQGVGELAKKMTEQDDYVACQIKHFWRWYVGQDVPMTDKREAELKNVFNSLGRKPKDFISYLVKTPEFNRRPQLPTEDQILARRAAIILKNCNSCHVQKEAMLMADWDLTDFPYSSNEGQRRLMINSLKDALDTRNHGLNKTMPPKNSNWKLSPEDFGILQKWLHSGAPDYNGKPQVAKEPL